MAKNNESIQTGWKSKHASIRKQEGLDDDQPRYSEQHDLAGIPLSSKRVRDLLDIAFAIYCKNKGPKGSQQCPWVVDISQGASRRPFFAFPQDRLLLPHEHLRLLGLQDCNTKSPTPTGVRELAGEAMGAPSVCICMLALFVCLHDETLWSQPCMYCCKRSKC